MQSPSIPPTRAALSARALVTLCALNHAALTGSRVAVSLSALAMGVSTFQTGLLLAVYALLPTLGSVWLGRWVDRAGARVPALVGMGMICIGLMLPTWQMAPSTLWLTVALVGGGYASAVLAFQHELVRRANSMGRANGLSDFALATAMSSSLGPLVAGHCIALGGTRLTFALLASVGLVAGIGATLRRGGFDCRGGRRVESPHGRLSVSQVLDDPVLRRILVVDLLLAIAWNANSFIVPIYGTQHGWSAAEVGNMLAVFGGAVLLVRALAALRLKRLDEWWTIRFALVSSGVCFLLLPFAGRLPFAFVLEFMMGIGLGGALPNVLVLLHAQSPAGRDGEVLGLRLVALNISAIVLPMCLGALGACLGMASVMWTLGASLSFGAIRCARGPRLSFQPVTGHRDGDKDSALEMETPSR